MDFKKMEKSLENIMLSLGANIEELKPKEESKIREQPKSKYYKIKFHNPRYLKDDVNGASINKVYTDLDQARRVLDKLSKMEKDAIIKDHENNRNPEVEKMIREYKEKGYTFLHQDENIVSDEWKRLKISEYNVYSIIRHIQYEKQEKETRENSSKMCTQLIYIEETNNIGIPIKPLTDEQINYLMFLTTD